jgi:hypothetical protein
VQFRDVEGTGGLGLEEEQQLELEFGVCHPASGAGVC